MPSEFGEKKNTDLLNPMMLLLCKVSICIKNRDCAATASKKWFRKLENRFQ